MHKRFDDIFSAIMLAAAVAVVLVGARCLSHSIKRVEAERKAIPVSDLHIEAPREESCSPIPTTTPTPDPYNPEIPLSPELQAALLDACRENDVPVALALGLIEVESGFREDAVSASGCVGLMQINPLYAWKMEENTGYSYLTSEGNIRCGIWYLSSLIERYNGSTEKALVFYNQGSYQGAITPYANAVLVAAERWSDGAL